jgi:ribosome biogenesis GTPase / thiamine phosphate phosphatase
MAPKFRGNSEDWMDDHRSSKNKRADGARKKMAKARQMDLLPEQANATVAEVFPKQCRVKLDGSLGSESSTGTLLCSYRRAQVIGEVRDEEFKQRAPVAVGDRVLVEPTGGQTGVLTGVTSRKNTLFRIAPGQLEKKFVHVLAANIDLVLIVASVAEPEFSPGLIDRFLVAAELEGIEPVIAVTKTDLLVSPQSSVQAHTQGGALDQTPWRNYAHIGYTVLELSIRAQEGLDDLFKKIQGKTVVFCGQSGVGKTSLLNTILGQPRGKVGAVSEATGKGRHTTTSAVLLDGPAGSQWIDTPGVREFGLLKVQARDLGKAFPEFTRLPCTQSGCEHFAEEQCDARSEYRYPSYLRIYQSLKEGEG